MEESLYRTNMKPQREKKGANMLRGYDPLKEIYHWNQIIYLLQGEMVLVCVTFIPLWNNVSFLNYPIWNMYIGFALIPLLLLMNLINLPFIFRDYRREKRRRDALRRDALLGANLPLTPFQPPAAGTRPSLPISLGVRLRKNYVRWMLIGALVVILWFAIDYLTFIGNFWQAPWFLDFLLDVSSIMILTVVAIIVRVIQNSVAGYYLHPLLRVDDEGISARYGRETISIAWRDIRYFALVNSTTFTKKTNMKVNLYSTEREAFEISDGENRICWLVAWPFPSHRLLWLDETALSAGDYFSLTQQLASLIVAKTNQPLLDFRLPMGGRRKKQTQPRAFSSYN